MKESQPFCCECFDKSHPKVCEGCKLAILVDQPNTEHEVYILNIMLPSLVLFIQLS